MQINPFYTTNEIPDAYFCDRVSETEEIVRMLTNGNNLVLKGPRRLGKSGLIHHVFNDKRIKPHYNTFYFDILETGSLQEFVFLFGRAIYKQLVPLSKKWADRFSSMMRSITAKFGPDPMTGEYNVQIGLQSYPQPELTLEAIFDFLEKSERPNLIAIDEFQQIAAYPEKRVEAMLRAHVQRLQNTKFIFSGSERHLLDMMFNSSDKPFYLSSRSMDVGPIPETSYAEFAGRMFRQAGKKLEEGGAETIYKMFDGFTFYLQEVMNEAFSRTEKGETCTREQLEDVVRHLVDSNTERCKDVLGQLTWIQRRLLIAVALYDFVPDLFAEDFVFRNGLRTASSVQSAARSLRQKNLLSRSAAGYYLPDRYLSLWIRRNYASIEI